MVKCRYMLYRTFILTCHMLIYISHVLMYNPRCLYKTNVKTQSPVNELFNIRKMDHELKTPVEQWQDLPVQLTKTAASNGYGNFILS